MPPVLVPRDRDFSAGCFVLFLPVVNHFLAREIDVPQSCRVDVYFSFGRNRLEFGREFWQPNETGDSPQPHGDVPRPGILMQADAEPCKRVHKVKHRQHDSGDDAGEQVGYDDRRRGDDEDHRFAAAGGAPEAIATPMHSDKATRKTTIDASKSRRTARPPERAAGEGALMRGPFVH